MRPQKKNPIPYWREMVLHIDKSWFVKKRGTKYLWMARDFANLRRAAKLYEAWGVMALWDLYVQGNDTFAVAQGFNVTEFVRQIPRIVDGNWKARAEAHRQKLMPVSKEAFEPIEKIIKSALAGKDFPK